MQISAETPYSAYYKNKIKGLFIKDFERQNIYFQAPDLRYM